MIKQNKIFIFVFSSREAVSAEIAKKFTEVLEKYIEYRELKDKLENNYSKN